MSFVWVLLACVFFAGPISAADQEVVWSYSNPDIDLYDDEALTIRWSGTHNVWSHSPSDDPDCAKASVEKKADAMKSCAPRLAPSPRLGRIILAADLVGTATPA